MAAVIDRDRGWKKVKKEMREAGRLEVAVGILQGEADEDGIQIAEYAAHNEYGDQAGLGRPPSRPFMAMSFDENVAKIDADFRRETKQITTGKRTARQSLTVIGQKHADRIKDTITMRDILPALSPRTVAAKKGSTKTLVDTGAMAGAVQLSIRKRGETK